jgi:hypothetical protein
LRSALLKTTQSGSKREATSGAKKVYENDFTFLWKKSKNNGTFIAILPEDYHPWPAILKMPVCQSITWFNCDKRPLTMNS